MISEIASLLDHPAQALHSGQLDGAPDPHACYNTWDAHYKA